MMKPDGGGNKKNATSVANILGTGGYSGLERGMVTSLRASGVN